MSLAAICLAAAAGLAAQGNAETVPELKLSTAVASAYPLGKAGQRWAEAINVVAAANFRVLLYPGAVLAGRDPGREFQAIAGGAADLAVGSALAWSAQLPALGAYVLPWLTPDASAQEALTADAALFGQVAAAAERQGVVIIAVAPLGERVLATVNGPVTAPAQGAGLRIRAPVTPLLIDALGALAIRVEAMSLADARAALAAGTLDGQEASPSTLVATRIGSTRQKFVTRWGAFADVMVFAVRRAVWEQWTSAMRADVTAAAREAVRDAAAVAHEDAAFADLTRQGITLIRLAPEQRAAFRAAVQPVWEKWTSAIGPDNVAAAKAAVGLPP